MKNKVKIAIVGSRTFNDYEFLKSAVLEVLRIEDISLIISGVADGVDTLAQKFAKEFGIPLLVFYPKWKKFGNSAGMKRNQYIIQYSDLVFAIRINMSKGTSNSIQHAIEKNIPIIVKDFTV